MSHHWLDVQPLKIIVLHFLVKCSAILLLPCRTLSISSVCCTTEKAGQLKLPRRKDSAEEAELTSARFFRRIML